MEPKSIRTPSTLIYSTALIRDAIEAKQSGTELSEIDSYLLPPALLQHYINERKPRRPPETTEGQAEGRRAKRAAEEKEEEVPGEPALPAPLNVSWSDFVDVNTANGYSVAKRTGPPPPGSSQKQQRKKRKGATDAQADTDTDGDGAEAGAEAAEKVFEVERILKKRVLKGKEAEYLVQWVGYPAAADNTWETAENLANSKALVAAFERDEKKQSSTQQTQGKKSPASRRRSNRASVAAAAATAAEDGSESDEYNLSQDTDFSQSQSQSESESRRSRAQAKRGIDSRSSKRLQTLVHELSGDSVTAGKILSAALPSNDPGVLSKRWTRAQDSKLLAVVAGKRSVKAAVWTEASAETGKSVADCKARRGFLQQVESQS